MKSRRPAFRARPRLSRRRRIFALPTVLVIVLSLLVGGGGLSHAAAVE